jgi:hypothetical protein
VGIYLGDIVQKILLFILLASFNTIAFTPQEVKSLGLNPDSDNQLALYTYLYEIGLKNKMSGGEFLGSGTCIDYKKNGPNSFQLVIGMKDAPFATGSHKLETNKDEYKKMKELMDMTDKFFGQARNKNGDITPFKPKLEIEGYADPQHNKLNFSPNQRKALSASNKLVVKTNSQKNNFILADLRIDEVKKTFFKGYSSESKPFISADLDRLESAPENPEDYKCDKRRGIVLKFDVDPSISFEGSPSTYSLGFKTSKGLNQKKMILSSVLDASDKKSLDDLPKVCQRNGVKEFHKQASLIGNYLKKYVGKNEGQIKEIAKKILDKCRVNPDKSVCNSKSLVAVKNADLKSSTGSFIISSYLLEASKNENYLKSILTPQENNLLGSISDVATFATLDNSTNLRPKWESVRNRINKDQRSNDPNTRDVLLPWKFYIGHKLGSYHTSCFSNELYYKDNFAQYTTNLNKLRNKETGTVQLKFDSQNIPTIKNSRKGFNTVKGGKFSEFKGFGCQACGHGLHLKDGKLELHARSSLKDHWDDRRLITKEGSKLIKPLQEEEDIYNMISKSDSSPAGGMKVADHMTPSVYIIKDCNPDNLTSSKRIRMDQFDGNGQILKEVKMGENDCLFQPDIVASCGAVPDGDSENSEEEGGEKASVFSLLAGKYLDINLKEGIKSFANELNKELVRTCQSDGLPEANDHNALIESIRCSNGSDSVLPTPGNTASEDCPDVARRTGASTN